MAPLFGGYLCHFQSEGPLIHVLFGQMKLLLMTVMKRFIKADAVNGLKGRQLLALNVSDPKIQLPLSSMDIGAEAATQVNIFQNISATYQVKNDLSAFLKLCPLLPLCVLLPRSNSVIRFRL